ncbi:MAG: hypothetical protein ACREQV_19410, partial [Candidatus Binatia bacterium]
MNIGIDARAFSWTGIGRYIRHLLQQYAQLTHSHQFSVLLSPGDIPAFNAITRHAPSRFVYRVTLV